MESREKSIEVIWREYHPKLQIYLRQRFPHINDVEDSVSDILLKVFEEMKHYDSTFALSTWIYTIARNRVIDELRKKQLHCTTLENQTIVSSVDIETSFINRETCDTLQLSIESLKPEEKELIFLYYYEELTYRDISQITGVPEGTLKYRMTEIRKKLRHQLRSII